MVFKSNSFNGFAWSNSCASTSGATEIDDELDFDDDDITLHKLRHDYYEMISLLFDQGFLVVLIKKNSLE